MDSGLTAIADALLTNNTLRILNMYCNTFNLRNGVSGLAEALLVNTGLTSLDIRGCSIGTDGVKVFAEALKFNSTLKDLSLEDNHGGDEGARAISEALLVNTVLKELNIGGNNIKDAGVELAGAVRVNSTLESLILDKNNMSETAIGALAGALKENLTITRMFSWKIPESFKPVALQLKLNRYIRYSQNWPACYADIPSNLSQTVLTLAVSCTIHGMISDVSHLIVKSYILYEGKRILENLDSTVLLRNIW